MTKHDIKLRRKGFSSRRIERHKNYLDILDKHQKRSRVKSIVQYVVGMLMLFMLIGLIYYAVTKWEGDKAEPNTNGSKTETEQIDKLE